MVFVNFPVSDLPRSSGFYEKPGFRKNEDYSNDVASAMVWDEHFFIMLLTHDFYRKFIGERKIADTQKISGALIAFNMPSAEAVKEFGRIVQGERRQRLPYGYGNPGRPDVWLGGAGFRWQYAGILLDAGTTFWRAKIISDSL